MAKDNKKAEETVETPQPPKSAQISYMCKGTKFDTLEEYIAIMKNDSEQDRKAWMEDLIILTMEHEEQYQKFIPRMTEDEIMDLVAKTPAITVAEAFHKYQSNSEQLMRVLSFLDPEEIVKSVNAKLINEETLSKTQVKTLIKEEFSKNDMTKELSDDMFETKEITYDDHYALYQIEGKTLHIDEDAYVVGCKCTTTGKNYFLFVEEQFASDAITAIASTMRNDKGERMSRTEYLKIESES